MIRSETEYRTAIERLDQDRDVAVQQREALGKAGLSPDADHAMQPLLSFIAQLQEEVAWYERAKRNELPEISRLTHIGRVLIALRIAKNLSQRDLAELLKVSESTVSRDENNEYHGVTVERAQRIIDAMNAQVSMRVQNQDRELVPA